MFESFQEKMFENILLIQGFEEVSYSRVMFPLEQTTYVNFFLFEYSHW